MTATTAAAPSGLSVRRPTQADVDRAFELTEAAEIAEHGESDISRDDVLQEWAGIDLNADAWLVEDAEQTLVGFASVSDRASAYFDAWVITHPEHLGRGISSHLIDLVEGRVAERLPGAPDGVRVVIGNFAASVNEPARRLLEARGYTEARRFWRMSIEMDEEPDAVEWPDGVILRTYVPGQDDRAIYEACDEAFSDHWGHVRPEFEKWMRRTAGESFDPATWYFAMDGEEIAGFSLCGVSTETPWVETLGVRRPWRKRGLGLGLLRHSFRELYRRGFRKVALGVDSQNLTGAVSLYERAGMKADREWVRFEKELRPGRDIATQSL